MQLNPFESPADRDRRAEERDPALRAAHLLEDLTDRVNDYNARSYMRPEEAHLLLTAGGEEGREFVRGQIERGNFVPDEDMLRLLGQDPTMH